MGFIGSANTITIRARLTKLGREKIISNNNTIFSHFVLGDSDANYYTSAILPTGKIPSNSGDLGANGGTNDNITDGVGVNSKLYVGYDGEGSLLVKNYGEVKSEELVIGNALAGKGKLIIHNIQKVNLTNYHSFEKKIEKIISQINPQIIRAFNPLVQGWLATKIGKKNGITVVISVHTNYNQQRELLKKERKYFKFLKLSYTSKKIETYCLKNADSIICVYEFIVPYVKKMGGKNIQVIYNKVDLQNFFPEKIPKFKNQIPTIISVGRLIDQKNHMYLLEAIKKMDAKLLIIGNGPNFYKFTNFIKSEGIRDKVEIIKSVPNHKLAEYYTSSDIYAQPMENLGGIPIPVLEAMACGLPIVM